METQNNPFSIAPDVTHPIVEAQTPRTPTLAEYQASAAASSAEEEIRRAEIAANLAKVGATRNVSVFREAQVPSATPAETPNPKPEPEAPKEYTPAEWAEQIKKINDTIS